MDYFVNYLWNKIHNGCLNWLESSKTHLSCNLQYEPLSHKQQKSFGATSIMMIMDIFIHVKLSPINNSKYQWNKKRFKKYFRRKSSGLDSVMLSYLPSEIIYHIAIYLPTANALTHLSQTCRRLYKIVSADEYRLFRALVQSKFPCTPTPPFWKDAACALTSRARALDRLGVIGRFVVVPENVTRIGCQQTTRRDNPTLGYRPAIDSYEIWNGAGWADRKEVLAWGAAHQLVVRVKQSGKSPQENWILFNDLDDVSSYEDICGVHLLQQESSKETDTEHLMFGRRRGDIIHLAISSSRGDYEYRKKFKTAGLELDRTDISQGVDSTLSAHFDDGSIAFYNTATNDKEVQAFAWMRNETGSLGRSRYSKLLSPSKVAVATGEIENSLSISTLSPDGISHERTVDVHSLDIEGRINRVYASVTSIAPVDVHSHTQSPGNIFLAAWGDHVIRLVTLSYPASPKTQYSIADIFKSPWSSISPILRRGIHWYNRY